MKSIFEKFGQQLVDEGILSENDIKKKEDDFMKLFKEAHEKGKKGDYDMTDGDFYNDFEFIKKLDGVTSISEKDFYELGKSINTIPDNFKPHKIVKEIYQN